MSYALYLREKCWQDIFKDLHSSGQYFLNKFYKILFLLISPNIGTKNYPFIVYWRLWGEHPNSVIVSGTCSTVIVPVKLLQSCTDQCTHLTSQSPHINTCQTRTCVLFISEFRNGIRTAPTPISLPFSEIKGYVPQL